MNLLRTSVILMMSIGLAAMDKSNVSVADNMTLLADFAILSREIGRTFPVTSLDPRALKVIQAKFGTGVNIKVGTCIKGSFSAPKQQETLILLFKENPMASHADGWKNSYILIYSNLFSSIIPVLNYGLDEGIGLIRGQDGVDRVLFATSSVSQGEYVINAKLAEFRSFKLKISRDFRQVFKSTCASGVNGKIKASKIYSKTLNGVTTFKISSITTNCIN